METAKYSVGDRVDKICNVCGEQRGHVVALLNKRGLVSRVTCPQCGTRSAFKNGQTLASVASDAKCVPYDWTLTYRKGQTMQHPTFGVGEVTAVIEPQKIDVLFADRLRRLVHRRTIS
jgi:hypothetical protein